MGHQWGTVNSPLSHICNDTIDGPWQFVERNPDLLQIDANGMLVWTHRMMKESIESKAWISKSRAMRVPSVPTTNVAVKGVSVARYTDAYISVSRRLWTGLDLQAGLADIHFFPEPSANDWHHTKC